ncbi:MAG: hypothetical protein D6704_05090 [Nitrospirae bacterium]|nr:MAG: hypothetical protein D6704_05090 [Nitrospirota bacterium]
MALRKESRLRWFNAVITLVLIVLCNAILLGGLWLSGINLDFVLSEADLYNPAQGYCVGVAWTNVIGVDGPIKVCSEWLDTTDPTGQVHTLRRDEPLVMDADGNLYYERARNADFQLLLLIGFVILVLGSGMWVKRALLGWYRARLYESES